jgi:sugar/nucleoside kinase (ribokinase family)
MVSGESRTGLRIGVTGTFIRDHTVPLAGEPYDNIGGLYYSLACLGALAGPNVQIVPVARVGDDLYERVVELLRPFATVDPSHLVRDEKPNTRVELHYTSAHDRFEITTQRMAPLRWSEVEVLRDSDVILVNMITGTDITRAAMERLAAAAEGWVYLDFHSLAYAVDDAGRRTLMRPRDWRDWVACAGGLQVNQEEASILCDAAPGLSAVRTFGESVTADLVQVCNVTAGAMGSHLFWRDEGAVRYRLVPAARPPRVVDVVGCGDAFAAGFVLEYLRSRDAVGATRKANRVAAANCTYAGSSGALKLARIAQSLGGDHEEA